MEVKPFTDEQMGRWLRRYRERHGLTQGDLAIALERTQASVSLIEKGERRLLAKEMLALIRAEQALGGATDLSADAPANHMEPGDRTSGPAQSSHAERALA